MKVYDAFPFYNELDLLRVRLVEHGPFVDHFILLEGSTTYTGKPKPFYFDRQDPRFEEFSHKIIHYKVPLSENPSSPWVNETAQRDAIIEATSFSEDDILLISDLDEIIRRNHWQELLQTMNIRDVIALKLQIFNYYINLASDFPWTHAKMCKYGFLADNCLTPTQLRLGKFPSTDMTVGWHFSFLSNIEFIRNKLEAFAHQECNTQDFNTPATIERAVVAGKDLFNRPEFQFVPVPVNSSWPLEMLQDSMWNQYVKRRQWPFINLPWRWNGLKQRLKRFLMSHFPELKTSALVRGIKKLSSRPTISPSDSVAFGFPGNVVIELNSLCAPNNNQNRWKEVVAHMCRALPTVDGWFSIDNCYGLFKAIVQNCPANGVVVEVGSWKGRSSIVCSHAAALRNAKVFCVDTWLGSSGDITKELASQDDIYAIFSTNMEKHAYRNYEVCRGLSVEVGGCWSSEDLIDVLFIDASHDFPSVLEDLTTWVPHVRSGGIVCGDDWNFDERPDLQGSVRKAFETYFKVSFPNGGIIGNFWYHRKF